MAANNRDDENETTSSETGSAGSGQGGFSLKPTARKKGKDKLIFIIIGGFGLLAVLLISGLAYLILHNSGDETEVEEKKVPPAPLLQDNKRADNSMTERMGFISAEKAKAEEKKTPSAPETSSSATTVGTADSGTGQRSPINGNTAYQTETRQSAPAKQPEEVMFTTIGRFESSGMSGGSGGGGKGSGYSASGADTDSREAQMREFINADPNELASELIKRSGGGAGGGGSAVTGSGSLLDNLNGAKYAATKAQLAPSGKFRLKKFTSFQCALSWGIKTNYPGFTKCTLTLPVYSADGSVILARAGAELRGEQKVELKAGQTSVFTSWTELETPVAGTDKTVFTQLNGLGTDAMGRSGTDAEIDNHWGMRIGNAVMLSTFQDAISNGSKRLSGGNSGSNNYSNTENTTQDIASKVLDANINIAPTGYVKPGTVINVVVAQDIDFSRVFTTRD